MSHPGNHHVAILEISFLKMSCPNCKLRYNQKRLPLLRGFFNNPVVRRSTSVIFPNKHWSSWLCVFLAKDQSELKKSVWKSKKQEPQMADVQTWQSSSREDAKHLFMPLSHLVYLRSCSLVTFCLINLQHCVQLISSVCSHAHPNLSTITQKVLFHSDTTNPVMHQYIPKTEL